MAITSNITEDDILTVLGDFITGLVDCEVIRAQTNRAGMPVGDFVAMTPITLKPLETNIHRIYTKDVGNVPTEFSSFLTPSQFTAQVDCYGVGSGATSQVIAALFRDDYACQIFKASAFDLQPLYASDPHQMPLINGEEQYEQRWTFHVEIQVNHNVIVATSTSGFETAGMLAIGIPPIGQVIGTVFVNGDGIIQGD